MQNLFKRSRSLRVTLRHGVAMSKLTLMQLVYYNPVLNSIFVFESEASFIFLYVATQSELNEWVFLGEL
jgi:hypothetical protein